MPVRAPIIGQTKMTTDVRDGSKREVPEFNRRVSFTPTSRHGVAPHQLTLCATTGHTSFNNFSQHEQGGGNFQAKRFRSFCVDDEFQFRHLLYGQISGFWPLSTRPSKSPTWRSASLASGP